MKVVHFDKEGCEKLHVRGEDQVFSLKGVLAEHYAGAISGADGYLRTTAVPGGEYWIVTTILSRDVTTATTAHLISNRHDETNVPLYEQIQAFGAGVRSVWGGMTLLDSSDQIQASFTGGLAGDTCTIDITGYKMTIET